MSKMIHPTTVEMVYIDNDALVSGQPCICASLCLSTISVGAQTLLMYEIDIGMQSEVVKGLNTVHPNANIPLEVDVLLATMHFWLVFLMFCLLVGPPNPRRLHPTSISYIFKVG